MARRPLALRRAGKPAEESVRRAVAVVKRREQIAEWVFVGAQLGIVVGNGDRELFRQPPFQQSGTLELLESRQIVDAV